MNTPIKETSLLFKAPMVRAILKGHKTQTRRIVKPQPTHRPIYATPEATIGCTSPGWVDADGINPGVPMKCPYGSEGDRLWVKETWSTSKSLTKCKPSNLAAGFPCEYAAGGSSLIDGRPLVDREKRWRPSIFMPRHASRINLEITAIRVERLKSTSAADAIAEGVEMVGDSLIHGARTPHYRDYTPAKLDQYWVFPIESYRTLWESINGKGSWARNPWVWVIEFERSTEL